MRYLAEQYQRYRAWGILPGGCWHALYGKPYAIPVQLEAVPVKEEVLKGIPARIRSEANGVLIDVVLGKREAGWPGRTMDHLQNCCHWMKRTFFLVMNMSSRYILKWMRRAGAADDDQSQRNTQACQQNQITVVVHYADSDRYR